MNYITISESDSAKDSNVGTISSQEVESKFTEAIEAHFNATMIDYEFANPSIFNNLTDCINNSPIDVFVNLNIDGENFKYKVSLSQTWMY